MWVELKNGNLISLDNNGEIFIRKIGEKFSVIYIPNNTIESVLFAGSKNDCEKVLYRLAKKLGAIDITNLLCDDEVVLDPVEAIRRLRHE